MKIEELDKNFKVDSEIDKTGLRFISADSEPIRLYGVLREGSDYRRVPAEVAEQVSTGVAELSRDTAGGRVRFVTDSRRLAVIAKFSLADHSAHMPYTNKAGIDIYADGRFEGMFIPPVSMPNKAFESLKSFDSAKERVITLNFPPYGRLSELMIGIDEGATIKAAPDYKYETPVVYYGSSITQGGCASRAGMTYQAILERSLDCNYINLGFSGNAKGEPAIVDYIASLDMSVFVCDYDHNAPTPEHLKATHEPLYRAVREKHPTLPIIFVTRPSVREEANRLKRLEIIKETYDKAVAEGDKNVYFLDASKFFGFDSNEHTVDGCHPTDLGFYLMAKGMEETIKEALEK